MIRVIVADDNDVIRQGLISLLEVDGDIEVVAVATNGREAVAAAREHHPDVVLLDVRMPVTGGVEAAGALIEHARVLMLSYADDEDTVASAIRAGASGYLIHGRFTPEELQQAVRDVADGDMVVSPAVAPVLVAALRHSAPSPADERPDALTARETEIVALLSQGLTNAEIAAALYISEKTVKNHLNHIYPKLGVSHRAEAIARWLGTAREPDRT